MTRLEEIQARADAATLGPWAVKPIAGSRSDVFPAANFLGESVATAADSEFGACRNYDAAFIANAREDVPYLLARLAVAETKLAAVEKLHTHAHADTEPWARGYKFSGDHCALDGQHWPCPTIAALSGEGK